MIGLILYYSCLFIVCIFAIPLSVTIALFIFIADGFPIVFTQKRIGKQGKQFILYKFRSMYKGSEYRQRFLSKKNEADGPVFKIYHDPRFFPLGRFLSHTGLDELPQLWNVLHGDMSLIGPRPLPVYEANKLLTWQKKRHLLKPGIISPWIFEGYHNKPFHAWMKSDIEYIQKKSFLYDLFVAFKFIPYSIKLILQECTRAFER